MEYSGSSTRNNSAFSGSDELDNNSKQGPGYNEQDYNNYPYEQPVPMVAKSSSKSYGIRKSEILVEQYTQVWFRVLFLFCIFLVSYAYGLDGTIRYTYQTYATASYSQHSLFPVVNIIRSVIGAAAQPTYARLSDIFGRTELFLFSVLLYALGTVIESQAYDIYRFAGGAVLYQVGYSGVMLILQVILADFSNLNWRLLCSLVPATPFIINTWVSGDIVAASLETYSWNFCIGMWAFIFPIACIPFVACLIAMQLKARRTPEWKQIREEEKETNKWTSWKDNVFVHLFFKLDIIGVLFLICILGFILVPMNIAGGKTGTGEIREAWKEAKIIAPLVVGFVLIPFFVLWEYKFTKHPIFPFQLMKDRGVWSALFIAIMINWVWYMPNDFMYTVLVVGLNASVKAATRITSLYSFVSVIVGCSFGLFIVPWNRRMKPYIMFGGACWVGSMAILYVYRGSNDGESEKYLRGVIGGLCLMGLGAGFFTYPTQVSIQTCTNHEHMAIVIALYLAFYNIGSAFGVCVSGAVWTNTLYGNLLDRFAEYGVDTALAASAYGDPFTFAVTYAWGTPERTAVALAYAEVQRLLCIIGLVLSVVLFFATFILRDHKLVSVQSLELAHEEEGVKAEDGEVVVNNYDEDVIFSKFRSLFKRKEKS